MKRIFPKYGINLIIIQRLKNNENYISASKVRKLLGEDKDISEWVPESTKKTLFFSNK